MKLGTQLRLPDGREATVVYNNLDGVGIKWGLHDPEPGEPEAMLREPWSGATLPCVGEEYVIIRRDYETNN